MFHNKKRLYEKLKVKQVGVTRKMRSKIKSVSNSRSKELAEYRQLKAAWMLEHQRCEIRLSPDCTGRNEAPHHSRGRRGKWLNKTEWWIASCNNCNRYIEEHPNEAREHQVVFLRSSTIF